MAIIQPNLFPPNQIFCNVVSFYQILGRLHRQGLDKKKSKSLLLSHHHSTSALVSEILMSVLQTVQKNNNSNLHMDSTYLQTVQKTMCKIHILSTHSVLLDICTVINTHYTPYVHIYIMYTYIHSIM